MSQDPVLVVEDTSVLSDLIRDLLEATGFSVVQASTSKDALELLKERRFRAILVESEMPGISGPDVVEEIKTDPEAAISTTPVLLLTREDATPDPLPGGLTPLECVHKPIDPVELITRIRAAVAGEPQQVLASAQVAAPVRAVEEPLAVKTSQAPGQGKIITIFRRSKTGFSTIFLCAD